MSVKCFTTRSLKRSKNTPRNIFPGLEGLKQLSKGIGVNEHLHTNYNKEANEELGVLRNNIEIKNIIANLSKEEDKKNGKV